MSYATVLVFLMSTGPNPTLELDLNERGERIHSLQKGNTDAKDEKKIAALLMELQGEALFEMKRHLDEKGSYRSTHHLLFRDIDDEKTRNRILSHFEESKTKKKKRTLVSDIDDTVYANWSDERFPKKTEYPGMRAFYRALQGDDEGYVVFVSARPYERTGTVVDNSIERMRKFGFKKATMLAGSLLAIHSNGAIAEQKWMNVRQYAQVYPESSFIFIGDSGQGDASLAMRMRTDKKVDCSIAFIHDVKGVAKIKRQKFAQNGVYFFDTYLDAARVAFEKALISKEDLRTVLQASMQELSAIKFEDPAQEKWALRSLKEARDRVAALLE